MTTDNSIDVQQTAPNYKFRYALFLLCISGLLGAAKGIISPETGMISFPLIEGVMIAIWSLVIFSLPLFVLIWLLSKFVKSIFVTKLLIIIFIVPILLTIGVGAVYLLSPENPIMLGFENTPFGLLVTLDHMIVDYFGFSYLNVQNGAISVVVGATLIRVGLAGMIFFYFRMMRTKLGQIFSEKLSILIYIALALYILIPAASEILYIVFRPTLY